jgi:trypsin
MSRADRRHQDRRVTRTRALAPVLFVVLLALALSAAAQAADDRNGLRIVQGQPANDGQFPYQAFVFIDTDRDGIGDSFCGGSLVGLRQVLTAAHCATDQNGNAFPANRFTTICIGVTDIHNNTGNNFPDHCRQANRFTVTQNDVHPDYGSTGGGNSHDVAMLTLDRLANGANMSVIRVVDLSESALWAPNDLATVTGWGTTSSGGSPPADWRMRWVNVPMRADANCASAYPGTFHQPTMVCAGNGNGDTCQGDSGGPLAVPDSAQTPVLAGVTSFGRGCNLPQFPGVYARLGSEPLNSWAHARVPKASFTLNGASPQAGQNATFTSNSTPANYWTSYLWDFDNDGEFDDASGSSVSRSFPAAGSYVVRLQVSQPSSGHSAVTQQTITVTGSGGGGGGGGVGGGGGGGIGGGSGDAPNPGVDNVAPGLSIAFARVAFGRALARGLRARTSCTESCRVTVVILPSRALARRLDLPRQIARGAIGRGSGTRTVVIRFTSGAKRRLRRVRRANLTIRSTAVDQAGNRSTVTNRARLTR